MPFRPAAEPAVAASCRSVLHSTAREGDPRNAGRVIEGMRKRRAIMVRMERVWNAVALGGVLGALLTTAGVVNLGNLPSWSSSGPTPTGSLVVAAEPAEMPAVTLASVTPIEPQPLPELPIVNAAFEAPEVSSEPAPLRATLTTPDGPSPALRMHDEIKATLLTTTDAYAYCYYADGAGSISRIFPNRFAPNALVRIGALELTGAFSLVADKPNRTEEVRCIAATKDLGSKLPGELQAEDLSPLPVASLNEISSMFRSLSQDVVETRLVVLVLPEQPTRSVARGMFTAVSY
jgi:hypothetical protein